MRVSGLNLDDRCINMNYKYIYVIQMNIGHIEVIPDNWTQKFEPHVGQISKPQEILASFPINTVNLKHFFTKY